MAFARGLAMAFLLSTVAILGIACGDDSNGNAPELTNPDQEGSELVNEYARLIKEHDVQGLEEFISDAFIIQRADGSNSEKAAYLENLPTITGEVEITDVSALQAGDALVVRWVISVSEVIDGRSFSSDPAPRLSTFVYEDGSWRLSSHANFIAPASDE
jgi:hypothetical protein